MLHLHRKKTVIGVTELCFLIGFIFLSKISLAQKTMTNLNLWDHDNKPYYFGITLGANFDRFQTEMDSSFLRTDSILVARPTSSGGVSLGLSATMRLSNRFELRFNPQLYFMQRNILYQLKYPDTNGDTSITKKIESVIVSFPLQVKFQSDRINNFRVYMLAGIKGDIDLASNARTKLDANLVKINKYDCGLELGLGFNFFFESFILSPEIKISNGLRNILSRDPNVIYSSVFDRFESRMIVFCIHIEG